MRIRRTITSAALVGALSSCTASSPESAPGSSAAAAPAAIACETLDMTKVTEDPIRMLGAAVRRCWDIVPETHRKFEIEPYPSVRPENLLAVHLPTQDGGELQIEAWSNTTPQAPIEEFAERTTRIRVGIYTSQDENTREGSSPRQDVRISSDQDPLFAQWADTNPSRGHLQFRVWRRYPDNEPHITPAGDPGRHKEIPSNLTAPEVVNCVRSEIIEQVAGLINSATFDAPVLPRLTMPDFSGICDQL